VCVFVLLIHCVTQVLVAWILDQAPLGFKAPLENRQRMRWCPLCPGAPGVELSARHVFSDCESVAGVRRDKRIYDFIVECKGKGFGTNYTMFLFLFGLDSCKVAVSIKMHYKRGADLLALQDAWLGALSI
jgi:hypothetical protein